MEAFVSEKSLFQILENRTQMPDLCRYCTDKGKQSLCVEGLRALGILKPGIDYTEPDVVPPKARVHLLPKGGNRINISYNPAWGAGASELTSGIKMAVLKKAP